MKSLGFRLFFLPFLLIGMALLVLAGMKVAQHLDALSWQPAPATLAARGVDVQKSVSGAERACGAARLSGSYSYQWQGRTYQGTRLSFSSVRTASTGADPDDWDDRLDALMGEPGDRITVWVNPRAPAESVLLRDLRWLEVGAMVGFGLLLVWLCSAMLFGDPRATPGFSWRTVGIMWLAGSLLAVLCPLLWRDGHSIWAVLTALPLLLAMHGTVHGLRLHSRR